MTTSLGPNCFGSLLIAVMQTLRFLISQARDNADDNVACAIFLCCIECLLAVLSDLIEYFNKYAFAQVAIYGKDYCTAGRDTWELVKSRGIDAIINDDLIGNVLTIGGFAIGIVTACVGLAYVQFSSLPKENVYYGAVSIGTFLIGIAEFAILSVVIDSGVATTFVCLAEDPLALARTKPELYQQVQQSYPQVLFF